ncbi:MAG TPA: class I SAM-dependent methyltransferase [Ilumatobacteraceae bacterium]|nr:class I SAM-dependent methyltransferase [Ilumatobacteraceae bacterium]
MTSVDMPGDPALAATRAAYDATAATYVRSIGTEISESIEAPLDRSILHEFSSLFSHAALVADLGCGPGRAGALLATTGAEVIGIDLSLAMVQIGSRAHPEQSFAVGDLSALALADRCLDGAVCWYSIIHTEPEHLDVLFDEIARVLVADGHLLVAFQAGNGERLQRTDVQGTPVTLTNYRHDPDDVVRRLTRAGFEVKSCVVRGPELAHESTAQAFVVARSAGRPALAGAQSQPGCA